MNVKLLRIFFVSGLLKKVAYNNLTELKSTVGWEHRPEGEKYQSKNLSPSSVYLSQSGLRKFYLQSRRNEGNRWLGNQPCVYLGEDELAPESWRRANIVINLSKEEKRVRLIWQSVFSDSKSWEKAGGHERTTGSGEPDQENKPM